MNISHIVLALAVTSAAVVGSPSQAAVPVVDAVGKAAVIRCGTTAAGVAVNASHADKIIFEINGDLKAQLSADQGALNQVPRNTAMDIKVLDNPRTVADLKGKVLTFLGAMDTLENREGVRIHEVKYAMVCPTTGAP